MMVGFGLVLLVPRFSAGFATATAGMSSRADAAFDDIDQTGLGGQVLGGALLGGGLEPLHRTDAWRRHRAWPARDRTCFFRRRIMTAFAAGVSTIILALGYGARSVIQRRQGTMRAIAARARPIMGAIFVAVGLGILFKLHHRIELWAIENLPPWLIDLSVSL